MTAIPLVDLKAQYGAIREEIATAIQGVLDRSRFILGPEVSDFEREFATYVGARRAIGTSSGTDALHLALRACGVRPGDEVITSPHTFIATAEAISMAGATPVFADIDERTYNLDPAAVEASLTGKTRAVIPVHLYGQPADLDPIVAMARKHGVAVIEDAAQAHGARYRGRGVGTIGDAACFSFYPGKNLGAYGDAGAVTTNDDSIAQRVHMLRDHGRRSKYDHQIEGFGNRLDTLQAAILRVKLRHLPAWTRRRQELAVAYGGLLTAAGIEPPFVPDWAEPVWHLFVVRVERRDEVREAMKAADIETGVHYPIPLHLQPAYSRLGYAAGAFPRAERAAGQVLSLPMYPELTEPAVARIVSLFRAATGAREQRV
jgi:dTDP-4-amino-4,6-dideoxygalactose transaminase